MTLLRRLLPQPLVSLTILGLWLTLAPAITIGQFVLGAGLALTIPWVARRFWPDPPRVARPMAGVQLFLRVVGDIVVANWQVARLVLGPLHRLDPKLVEVPLSIEDPFVATLLGSIVSLTPGTVSIEIDRARRSLLVHGLDVKDGDALADTIKRRYEAPLKEIFRC